MAVTAPVEIPAALRGTARDHMPAYFHSPVTVAMFTKGYYVGVAEWRTEDTARTSPPYTRRFQRGVWMAGYDAGVRARRALEGA